ncbi:MAG: hypothetical protein COB78_03425 [Hyphomicrobiales bacterium]|nr:MAG: hypothetical protein COB78_03425 [Hyphomicrobiales bacterium]
MSNTETVAIEETDVEETNATVVINVLMAEIAEIAKEVENLPLGGDDESPNAKIMAMQNIDLCSQRLRDISKVMQNLTRSTDISAKCSVEDILDDIWLQHTQDAIKESR